MGPGRCYLCKLESETNDHIGFECSFTRTVWSEIEDKLRYLDFWHGYSVSDCVKNWILKAYSRLIKLFHRDILMDRLQVHLRSVGLEGVQSLQIFGDYQLVINWVSSANVVEGHWRIKEFR